MSTVSHLQSGILERIKPIHRKFRSQKTELFLKSIGEISPHSRLLDVGGGPGVDGEFLSLYSRFADVMVVNLDSHTFEVSPGIHLRTMVADGRALPFRGGSFDWVFSNAVIEHVGGWKDQVRFAEEIRRVASKGYFVATPNRHFPLEPHTLIPFYQFFPVGLQRRVAPYSPGYLRRYEEINLLSASQMQDLFPEASILLVGTPVIHNNLIASYRATR
ncbi:MAG TPA: class I SAM-dependent methyltransferase [Candidatus Dormibacteraeota bacterium]|nr:class I SAM-dependent methyltransferase [Candidatus Dormibacteraeota bacterium]